MQGVELAIKEEKFTLKSRFYDRGESTADKDVHTFVLRNDVRCRSKQDQGLYLSKF